MGVVSVCGGWVLRGGVIGGWCVWGVVVGWWWVLHKIQFNPKTGPTPTRPPTKPPHKIIKGMFYTLSLSLYIYTHTHDTCNKSCIRVYILRYNDYIDKLFGGMIYIIYDLYVYDMV